MAGKIVAVTERFSEERNILRQELSEFKKELKKVFLGSQKA